MTTSEKLTTLDALIERVERATGPDRELDLALLNCFAPHKSGRPYRWGAQLIQPGSQSIVVPDIADDDEAEFWRTIETDTFLTVAPTYTASIDAALALVERVMPGLMYSFGSHNENNHIWACLTSLDGDCPDYAAEGPTLPLAIILARLRALRQQGAQE